MGGFWNDEKREKFQDQYDLWDSFLINDLIFSHIILELNRLHVKNFQVKVRKKIYIKEKYIILTLNHCTSYTEYHQSCTRRGPGPLASFLWGSRGRRESLAGTAEGGGSRILWTLHRLVSWLTEEDACRRSWLSLRCRTRHGTPRGTWLTKPCSSPDMCHGRTSRC